ncbi:MAG TPA: hypothetical protein VHD69_02920 [Candidatus Paceibacterota bacterium]|nr:hypothetical protein [Candidatus Paceibacterota bacterium]
MCLSVPAMAHAGTSHNMSGYAWSSTIGWISFNCTNDSSCATADYGVNKDADGTLHGYAWASTIGWIQFSGLSGFPSGPGTTAQNAQVIGSNVVGWAQAIAANGNGWDGWIALSGTSYGVTLSGTAFTGYAWGGDTVGWVSWNCLSDSSCGTANYNVNISGDAALDITSGGSTIVGSSSVPYGTIPTFVWTLTSLPVGTTCSVSKTSVGGTAFTTINGITTSGSTSGDPLTDGPYTFQIQCANGGSTLVTKTASFTVAAQPPGFDLGPSETAFIQFLNAGEATSQQKSIFVSAFGGFSNPVTISITGFPTAPASTTFSYSLGGSAFSANPSAVVISSPYASGTTLKIKVTRVSGAPAFTGNFTVTLTGTASGASADTKDIVLTPTTFVPAFQEF